METEIKGAVKIGRSGTKLHPATKTLQPNNKYTLWIHCGCPGTRQGGAYHGAQFFTGLQANCKN